MRSGRLLNRASFSSENDSAKVFDSRSSFIRRRFHLLQAVRSVNGLERFEPC